MEIRRIARNPVMLTALAVVHWNERRLPEQRADLYESIVVWLARAREQRPEREPADRCLELLGELALAMQNERRGRVVQVDKGRAAEMLTAQFREVSEPERFRRAERFLEEEEVDSGIVVSRGAEMRFWHLTFQEYLAARAAAGLSDAAQRKLLFEGNNLHRPEWREMVLLLAGVLLVKLGRGKVDGLFQAVLDGLGEKPRCWRICGYSSINRWARDTRESPSECAGDFRCAGGRVDRILSAAGGGRSAGPSRRSAAGGGQLGNHSSRRLSGR
jgi:hypothetical protein